MRVGCEVKIMVRKNCARFGAAAASSAARLRPSTMACGAVAAAAALPGCCTASRSGAEANSSRLRRAAPVVVPARKLSLQPEGLFSTHGGRWLIRTILQLGAEAWEWLRGLTGVTPAGALKRACLLFASTA